MERSILFLKFYFVNDSNNAYVFIFYVLLKRATLLKSFFL